MLNQKLLNQKQIAVLFCTVVLLNIAQPASAQVSEFNGKKQTPAQIGITIGLCAIALKVLDRFNLP